MLATLAEDLLASTWENEGTWWLARSSVNALEWGGACIRGA